MPARVTGWGASPGPRVVLRLAAAVAAGCLVLLRPRRVAVVGPSMLPGLLPGDHLLVVRCLRPRAGRVVVVASPAGTEVVKRLVACGPRGVEVRGDNPSASTDSRTWGPLPRTALRGCVVYRYAPAARAGTPRVRPG